MEEDDMLNWHGEKKKQEISKAYAWDDEDSDEGDKVFKKGAWTSTEDATLVDYIQKNGEGDWNSVDKNSGISRGGNSCRWRWKYHLRPDLKKGPFSEEEELRVVELQAEYGNKWARIATELPGRTDQDVRNFWRTKGIRIAGKPLSPSGIVLKHSTESGESDMLDRHTSGSNHSDLLQEGNSEIPIPNPDIAQHQSNYSLPHPTSSLHEVAPLCLTRRNSPSDSYNSYPFVNASEMNEIPPVDQHVYSPEVVAEPLVEPSPHSLVGVSPDTSCFGQPLSDVLPGTPEISNCDDFDSSNTFSEAPNVEFPPLQYPDACLSSQDTPAADHPLCLNQSSPAHPCQPVHPSPPGSIGHLEDIAYQEKCFPSQITDFSTGVVPTKDVNQSSYSPLGGHVYSPEVVAEPLVEPSPQSLVGVSPDTSCFGQPLSDVLPGTPQISNYGDFDSSNTFSEAPNVELPPFQYPDACLSSQDTPAADRPLCLNQSSPAHPCQPVHPSPPGSIGHLEDIDYQEKCFPCQITGFSTGVVPTKDVNQSSYSPLGGNPSFMSNAVSVHESSAEENQPFDEDAFVAGFLNDNEEPDDTDNCKPDDDVLNYSRFRRKF